MIGWAEILRRRLVGEQTAGRIASMAMYAFSLGVFLFGMRKLIRLDLNEKELFFGVVLVCNLAITMSLAGFAIDLMARFTDRADRPAGSRAAKLHSCDNAGRVSSI